MLHKNQTLLLATNNTHKFVEARNILLKHDLHLEMVNIEKLEIQHNDLREIAFYSLRNAIKKVKMPLLVEDAGLFIDRLSGFPGPYSSYVYKTLGIQGVLKLLEGETDRTAQFKSVVAYATLLTPPKTFLGVSHGRILNEQRGSRGFGFDPIFMPRNRKRTFAEMPPEEKNIISHRAKAFDKFAKWYSDEKLSS